MWSAYYWKLQLLCTRWVTSWKDKRWSVTMNHCYWNVVKPLVPGHYFCHCNRWFIFYFLKILTAAKQALNTIRLVCTHGNFRGSEMCFEIKLLLLLQHRTPFPNCNALRLLSSQVTARQPGWTSAAFPQREEPKLKGHLHQRNNSLTSHSSLICFSSKDWLTVTFVERSLFLIIIFWLV